MLKQKIKETARLYQESVQKAYSNPELFTDLLAKQMNFKQYSALNRAYIHYQDPHATYVASFNKWKQLGFPVKEKGCLYVLCPVMKKFLKGPDGRCVPMKKDEEDTKLTSDEYKQVQMPIYYRYLPVFDISKTEATEEDLVRILAKQEERKEIGDLSEQKIYEVLEDYYGYESDKTTFSEKNYDIIKKVVATNMADDEEVLDTEKNLFVEACTYITLKTLGLKNVIFDYNVMKNHPEDPERLVKFHKRLCTCAEKRVQEVLVAFL